MANRLYNQLSKIEKNDAWNAPLIFIQKQNKIRTRCHRRFSTHAVMRKVEISHTHIPEIKIITFISVMDHVRTSFFPYNAYMIVDRKRKSIERSFCRLLPRNPTIFSIPKSTILTAFIQHTLFNPPIPLRRRTSSSRIMRTSRQRGPARLVVGFTCRRHSEQRGRTPQPRRGSAPGGSGNLISRTGRPPPPRTSLTNHLS